MASYKSLVRKFDTGVGAVLDAINEAGLADNTLVICTTDHGIAFPAMKCNLTDHGTGVMLIVRGPGGFTGGKVIDGMVQHMDLFPTICDLLEIDRPDWLQGKSVLPLIHGGPGEIHDEIFTELTYHATYEPQRAVRTPRWKYVRRFDDEPRVHRPNCDASPSKDVWLEHGWADRNVDREQLYDLIFDPNEACNRAEDPDCAEVLTDLRNRLDRWMEQTDDPLRNGPIPVPAGGKVNSPDQLHPSDPGVE